MTHSRIWENRRARAFSFNPIFMRDLAVSFLRLPRIKNWGALVRDHFHLSRDSHFILEWRDGARLQLRTGSSDGWTVQETILTDYYRLDQLKLRDAILIDLGANIGSFSILAAARYPRARLYAYEPEPRNYEMLCANIALNGFEARITPRAAGSSSDNRELALSMTDNAAGHSHYWRGAETIRVPSASLKNILARDGIARCDLLKMDIEGSEYETLYTADAATLAKISRLYVEYHQLADVRADYQARPLADFLQSQGFAVEQFVINRIQGYLYCERVAKSD